MGQRTMLTDNENMEGKSPSQNNLNYSEMQRFNDTEEKQRNQKQQEEPPKVLTRKTVVDRNRGGNEERVRREEREDEGSHLHEGAADVG